jgi:hypothetical protein
MYLRDKSVPRGFEVCRLLDRSHTYSGKSLFEIEELGLARRQGEAAGENDRQKRRIFIDGKMAEIRNRAKRATKGVADPDIPKSRKVAGIRHNRAEEKEIQRGAESFDLADTVAADQIVPSAGRPYAPDSSETGTTNVLKLLERKRKEREDG